MVIETMCARPGVRRQQMTTTIEATMSKRPQQNTHIHGDPAAPNIRDPEQKGDKLERHPTPPHKNPLEKPHPEQPEHN